VEQNIQRLRLRVAAKLMGVLGLFGMLYVLLSMMFSANPDANVVPSKVVNIAGLQAGEFRTELWEGRPVLIYRRTPEQVASLQTTDERLRDADSNKSRQPDWAKNALRSRLPEIFVSIGVGTDFGCPLKLEAASEVVFMSQPWTGGFVDGCRAARYDFSGRVYKGQYATENLWIPNYRIVDDKLILGG